MNVLNKLTKEEWNSIERPVDFITKQVLDKLLYFNRADDSNDQSSKLKTCGEEMYLIVIRPQLVKLGYLGPVKVQEKEIINITGKKGKKEKKPIIKKDDIIKMQNLSATVNREQLELFKTFNNDKLSFEYGLRKDIIELRVATLIYMCHFYSNKRLVIDDKVREDIYKLIQTIRTVIGKIKEKKFKSKLDSLISLSLSQIVINDLVTKCTELENIIKFDIYNIFSQYPWLTDTSNYYKVIPEFDVSLYKCQKEILELTKGSESFLGMYKSNFGSGKTTATIGVVANQIQTTSFVIYCCASDAVRHSVSQMAYNASIKFAIANIYRDTIRITKNNLCKTDAERKLIISDYLTTYLLLKDTEKYLPGCKEEDIILIIDEPTDGADEDNNVKTKYFSRIFYHAPRRTLLVSATLPSQEKLQPYIDHFKSKHGDVKIATIISKDVKVGCEVILRDGTSYSPHNDCHTKEDLECVLTKLDTDQFVSRLYTANILISLYNSMKQAQIQELPDLITTFMQTENLNHNTIKRITMNLLKILSNQSSSIITEVCKCKSTYSRQDIYGCLQIDKTFTYDKLGTTDAHKFLGPTLLIDSDPFKLADSAFNEVIGEESALKLIEDYKRAKASEKKNMTRLEKEMDKLNASKLKEDRMSKETRAKEMTDIMDSMDTQITFQPWCQINTFHHLSKYAKHIMNDVNKKYIRRTMDLTSVPFETKVDDSLITKRFAGVGIYVPHSSKVDNLYTNDVIENTLMGTLAYTLSDTSISYGVNSPADNIIICDAAIRHKSINTILQLLARVGRPGLSWTAFAFIDLELRQILHNYIFDKHVYNPEAEHMNKALDRYKVDLVKIEHDALVKETKALEQQKQQAIKDLQLKYISKQKCVFEEEHTTRLKLEDIESRLRKYTSEQFISNKPRMHIEKKVLRESRREYAERIEHTTEKDNWCNTKSDSQQEGPRYRQCFVRRQPNDTTHQHSDSKPTHSYDRNTQLHSGRGGYGGRGERNLKEPRNFEKERDTIRQTRQKEEDLIFNEKWR